MKTSLLISTLILCSLSRSNHSYAADEQNLGLFALQISPAVFDPRENKLNIQAPQADSAFADFSYEATQTANYSFSNGSGATYHCDKTLLGTRIFLSETDPASGAVTTKELVFSDTASFQKGRHYTLRFMKTHLLTTKCEFITTAFLVYPKKS